MEFTINFDETTLEIPMREAAARIINERCRQAVEKQLNDYFSTIEKAVEVYLAKRLTDVEIKKHIDESVARLIEERLRD